MSESCGQEEERLSWELSIGGKGWQGREAAEDVDV